MTVVDNDALQRPVHPGEVLLDDFLRPNRMTAKDLAIEIDIGLGVVQKIIQGRQSITPVLARLLANCFGTSEQLWMNLQADYDRRIAQDGGASTNP